MVGNRVVTVEHISTNHPALMLYAWESLAAWWKTVTDAPRLEDDLAPVAEELLEDDDLDQPARELLQTWLREQEEEN